MNAKILFTATVAVALASGLALAGEAQPLSRADVVSDLQKARTDGTLRQIPLSRGYDNAKLEESHAGQGMNPVRNVHNYRGFVFAKLNDTGLGFEEFFGESLSSIDNMVDRSPVGRLGGR